MGDEDTNPNGIGLPADGGTKVDLGEDLLEQNPMASPRAETTTPTDAATSKTPLTVQEEISNGEILFNENLLEDAKKIFRRVARRDPDDIVAKKWLEEIQKKEIQELLASDDKRGFRRSGFSDDDDGGDLESVVSLLERDLRLSLDKIEMRSVPDLFPNTEAEAAYVKQIKDALPSMAARDSMDLGIAFLEMGLYAPAKAIFEELIKREDYKNSGMYLLAIALIYGGECIEATIRLEPQVRDLTLNEAQKADFLYLMGLAFEKINDSIKAKEFFRRVHLLNPRYRDVAEKIR